MNQSSANLDTEDEADAQPLTDLLPLRVSAVKEALDAGDEARVTALVQPLHDADLADLVQNLSGEQRRAFLAIVRLDERPYVLAELDEAVRDEVIELLGVADTAAAVAGLETDDAVHVLETLDETEQRQVLDSIPQPERLLLEEALAYPEGSAGRLMQRELVAVPSFWTAGETIDHLRYLGERAPDRLPENFHDIYVVDPRHQLLGSVPAGRLLCARRSIPLAEIMITDLRIVSTSTDEEEVAFLFRQRDLTAAPVVDASGRLVGMITIDDVVDVIDEVHEDEIMHLGGVGADDLHRPAFETVRARFAWLLVNLGTAILASLVIGLFDGTIEHMVALAVLMPIVASMGGNAGTQTLTVAVRALATKDLTRANALRVIAKELLVGALNGGLFAVIAGVVAWIWFDNPLIAVVIGVAMIINLTVAALAGAVVPLVLEHFDVDPAIASGVFVTTVTDVVGFFGFLGLATLMLM
ncbi:MAG: magnesium transporter [Rhodospirillales bacterium]